MSFASSLRIVCATMAVVIAFSAMPGCSTGARPKPVTLQPINSAQKWVPLWNASIGKTTGFQSVVTKNQTLLVASDRNIEALDVNTGNALWKSSPQGKIVAGPGFDGRYAAVVTADNQLVVFDQGRELWHAAIRSSVFTTPVVAGERVFILTAERTVEAFDVLDGRRLWVQQKTPEPLGLAQAGVLFTFRGALMAGLGSRLVALDPNQGNILKEWLIATPRGTNEVERLADLVAPLAQSDRVFCVQSFQNATGCISTATGQLLWSKTSRGYFGAAVTGNFVVGADANDRITARDAQDGRVIWDTDSVMYHGLSGPVGIDDAVVFGDESGILHVFSSDQGKPLARIKTDGTPILTTPLWVKDKLIVLTRGGKVAAFRRDAPGSLTP